MVLVFDLCGSCVCFGSFGNGLSKCLCVEFAFVSVYVFELVYALSLYITLCMCVCCGMVRNGIVLHNLL